MRRHDKKLWMEHVNKKFQKRCLGESSLTEYNPEEDRHDYFYPYDQQYAKNEFDPYELKEKIVGLGDDLEYVDEECSCELKEEPTDVKKTQWFSKVDGEIATDKIFN